MPTFMRFEDIEAWQGARQLVKEVYLLTRTAPCARDRAFCDQLQRAAVSAMSNIAEGFERDGNREFRRFLAIAKGSVGEVRSLAYVALDLGYLEPSTYERLTQLAVHTSRRIAKLSAYLEEYNPA